MMTTNMAERDDYMYKCSLESGATGNFTNELRNVSNVGDGDSSDDMDYGKMVYVLKVRPLTCNEMVDATILNLLVG